MEIVVQKKSVEVNLIFDILIWYENKDIFELEFEKLGINIPKECLNVYSSLDKSKSETKELIKYYFNIDNDKNKIYCLSEFFRFNLNFYDLDFEEYIYYMEKLTKEEVFKNIMASVCIFDEGIEFSQVKELIDNDFYIDEDIVISKIDKSELECSLKWKLYKIIKDYKKAINDIICILKEVKCNETKAYKHLLDLSNKWAEEIEGIFNNKGIEYLFYLDKNINLSNIKKVHIKPLSTWKCYNFECISLNDEEVIISIGYNIEQTMDRFRRGKSEEWFKDVLKLLADPTRYKILKLLSKREMYSGELAIETGMSQGTISHHMSSLVLYDLVDYTRREGRAYYKLNKEKFKIWVDMLRKKL